MLTLLPYAANLIAISVLVFGLYLPRHHRRDLGVALIGVNVGVMAVSIALLDTAVAAGLGLGLFGVLSIIRLRSDELSQREVAYYFSALSLGLLGGLSTGSWLTIGLMAVIVGVLAVADHPSVMKGMNREVVNLARAITDESELRSVLSQRLNGRIHGASVQKVDFVNDTTLVEVRFTTEPTVRATQPVASDVPELERIR